MDTAMNTDKEIWREPTKKDIPRGTDLNRTHHDCQEDSTHTSGITRNVRLQNQPVPGNQSLNRRKIWADVQSREIQKHGKIAQNLQRYRARATARSRFHSAVSISEKVSEPSVAGKVNHTIYRMIYKTRHHVRSFQDVYLFLEHTWCLSRVCVSW